MQQIQTTKMFFISILCIYKWIRLVNKVKAECVPKRMNYQQQNKWKQEAIEIEWLGVSNLWLVAEIDELVNSKKNEDPVSEVMVS